MYCTPILGTLIIEILISSEGTKIALSRQRQVKIATLHLLLSHTNSLNTLHFVITSKSNVKAMWLDSTWVSTSSRPAVGHCSFQSEIWQYFAQLLAFSTLAGCASLVHLCMLTMSAITLEQLARITSNFHRTVYPWCIIWYKISTILVISNPLLIPTTMQVHSNMLWWHTSK